MKLVNLVDLVKLMSVAKSFSVKNDARIHPNYLLFEYIELLLELKGKRENICHSISAPFDSFDCMYVKKKKRVLIKCSILQSLCQTYALSVKQDDNG